MARRGETAADRRLLGNFERAQFLTGERFVYNLVAVIAVDGGLAPECLRAALDEVQRRTPLLRSRVDGSGRGAVLRLAPGASLPLRCVEGGGADWLRRVEEELESGFDLRRGPLARCLLLTPPAAAKEPARLFLTLPHAIADGPSVVRLLRDLLSLCVGGSPSTPGVENALPPSLEERFPRSRRRAGGGVAGWRFLARQMADELGFRWRRLGSPARPPAAAHCRALTTALPAEATTALVDACRGAGVSLTAVLEAAMLLAVSRQRYGGARRPLRYFVFPLLRPYLQPPIEPGVFASYLVALRFTLEVAADDELWSVAAAIGRQIDAAVGGDDKYFAAIWSPLSIKLMLHQRRQRMGTTALSYTGGINLETVRGPGGELEVGAIHSFVSNFTHGPEYTAQARIHCRRLIWDIVYLDADMTPAEAEAIAAKMKTRLIAGAED